MGTKDGGGLNLFNRKTGNFNTICVALTVSDIYQNTDGEILGGNTKWFVSL
jgi:hypothetical protein